MEKYTCKTQQIVFEAIKKVCPSFKKDSVCVLWQTNDKSPSPKLYIGYNGMLPTATGVVIPLSSIDIDDLDRANIQRWSFWLYE